MSEDIYNRMCEAVERLQQQTPRNFLIVSPRQLVGLIVSVQKGIASGGVHGIWANEAATVVQCAIDNLRTVDAGLADILQRGFRRKPILPV